MIKPKKLISPLQEWLLIQGRCVGCGRPLKNGQRQRKDGIFLVTCDCQRVFIYRPKEDSYQRALMEDLN